jgi:hypothetical protein
MSEADYMRHTLGSREPVERDPVTARIYERGSGALSHPEQSAMFQRQAAIAADIPRAGERDPQTGREFEIGAGCLPKALQVQKFLDELPPAAKAQRQADANALLAVEAAGRPDMTARTTFEAAVQTASKTQLATVGAAETTRQVTVDAALSVVAYATQSGNYAALAAAVAVSNLAKSNATFAAEQAKQAARDLARDTLRATGDVGPV